MPVLFAFLFLVAFSGCSTFQTEKPTECPIHHVPLHEELVVPRTGERTLELEKAGKAEFPYSGAVYNGQIAPSNISMIERGLVCPECRRAETKWLREHLF